jgi:putative DNA primase/helicase
MKDPTILQNIPVSLRGSPQWVAWKGDKIPVDPKTGRNAKANDPETWGTYRESLKYFRENDEIMGIGYQFSADDAFAGVDLDKCRDPETGKIEPWAQEIIERLNSYTEVSPSGTGIHIILIGKVPPGGNKKDKIEMYSQTRYFTVTGDHLEGTPTTIEDRQTELSSFHAEIFQQQEQESQLLPAEPPPSPKELSDEELIEKAQQAGNGKKFAKLWRGDLSDYASPSEGTLALLNMLVFWCGPDRVRIDRLFRKSGLMREKWDRPQLRSTWGALEIEKAIAVVKESYDPEKDIKVPEKGKGKNKRIELGINDLEESRLLHAAINFKDEIMGLGFRVDLPDGDTGVTILISDGVIVKPFINPEEIKIDGLSYKITKGSIPPRLEDVWDLKRL